ncbi:MAG: calcium/sodium antiporter [Pseudomonadales bacterium]|nr:calcium/sodium antiporter [Pseudomonadales bacterium]
MLDVVLLAVGLIALFKGADLLVSGAISIAAGFGISNLVIGLTIVSFGTSLPEMLVSMTAGLRGDADLAIANVLGSNIANVLLILGVAAMIRPLPVRDSTVESEIPFSLTAALLVGFLANAALFSSQPDLSISRLDGVFLLFFFFLFMLYVYKVSRTGVNEGEDIVSLTKVRATIYITLGIALLYLGGEWVVSGAIGLAHRLGIDDALIGLTVVAVGTSMPELVASAVAAKRGQCDIAVGNVVGSNIFNMLWILGVTATVVDLPFTVVSNTDLAIVIGSSTLILLAVATSKRNAIERWQGAVFIVLYIAYTGYVISRA